MAILPKIIVKIKHDSGTDKVTTWAQSIEQAIEQVCTAKGAPKDSVIYAKVAPLTISDIKAKTEQTAPYFFSRQSMRFFGQRMADFSVTRYGNDKFLISAKYGGEIAGKTERVFNPFTNELERIN